MTRSPHGPLAIPCQNCHTFSGWKPIRNVPEFDHSKTRYPLRGMHQNVACTQCHTKPVFTNVGTKCADCHADIHRRQMGAACDQCHNVKGWRVSLQSTRNNHQNRFPLTGAHAMLQCEDCHKGAATGQFQGLSTACYSCHSRDFQKTTVPNHVQSGFSTSCEQCHSADTWAGAAFDHLKMTGFALSGAHARLDCAACHASNRYQGTPATCVGCHLQDFQKASNPNHVQSGLPQTCQQCHTTVAWSPASFDHNLVGFPLTGMHATLQCSQCHANGRFTGTPTDCASCHLKDYQATSNPNHAQAGFPTTCASCHNTTAWTGATFNHASTGFALTGAHATVQCSQCHANGRFAGTPTDCASCHLKDYQGATNPNHVQSGFPTTCASCHNTTAWTGATFNHAATGFALTGMHATLQCAQCHANGRFAGTPTDCASCHLTDYQNTTNPNHAQAGFPTDCSICHSTTNWLGAVFDHSKTLFPLTGFHATVSCAQCHSSGVYKGLSTACASCHLKDFNATTNPNHTQAGFPQQCEVCHNTTAWIPASFDHNKTNFPLTGAHTTVACANCHVGGKYLGTPTDCYSCHKTVYQSTTNPNHMAAGFPTTCQTCHNTTAWTGATFNHTWFPMNHGSARVCADCHTNPSNYTVFTCTNCHGKTQTDSNHSGVRNYVYNSANCYSCHPSGRGG
jgi:hypothetical protein